MISSSIVLPLLIVVFLRHLIKWIVFYYKIWRIPTAPGSKFLFGHALIVHRIMIREKCTVTNGVRLFLQEVTKTTAPQMSMDGIFKIFLGPIPLVVVSSPEAASTILKKKSLPKSFFIYDMSKLLMNGLVNLNGLEFEYHKKLLLPSLGGGNYTDITGRKAHAVINQITYKASDNHQFEVTNMQLMTTKYTEGCLWDAAGIKHDGGYFSDAEISKRWKYFEEIETYVGGIDWLPWHLTRGGLSYNKEGQAIMESMKHWTNISKEPVLRVKDSYETLPPSSFVRNLLEEHYRNPEIFTLDAVIEEVKTIVAGGVETTSSLLCWALHLIGHRQDVQDKMIKEIDYVFRGKTLDYIPVQDDLKQLIYTKSVIKEAMRLHANGAIIGRTAHEDLVVPKFTNIGNSSEETELSFFVIPKGCDIAINIEGINQHPIHWKHPAEFDPERHLSTPANQHPYSFCSFSGGQRICPGQNIAKIESLMFIIRIFREFRIQSSNTPGSLRRTLLISLHVKDPVSINFTRR